MWYTFKREKGKKMQKILRKIQKISNLEFKTKRIYLKKSKDYDASNEIHAVKTSSFNDTLDPRFVEQGWYPHIKTKTGSWVPVGLGNGNGSFHEFKKYPDYLHYYTISRRQGQKRKVTKHIIDINKEVQKCVKTK